MCRRPVLTLSVAILTLLPALAIAQDTAPAQPSDAVPPAHVAVVDGTATLERQGQPVSSVLNMPLLSGDRLRTAAGRVEVEFADGSTLELDNNTTVDFQSDTLIRLIEGRVRVTIDGTPNDQVSYRVDAAAGSVVISTPGDYRVALLTNEAAPKLELAVFRGQADLTTDLGSTPVQAGQRAYASAGLLPSYAYAYNSAEWDPFDQWVEARHNEMPGPSSQYLPDSMQSYSSTLDEYGDWRYAEPYGYVWYPRVAAGWRPYYDGQWVSLPQYGWTWVGADAFGWPTHHFGRWGLSAGAWFWIPGTRWSSAWVSWAYAPGYVSWCPLGFDNRPVLAFTSIFSYRSRGRFINPWSVVRADGFGGRYVPRHLVPFERLDARSRAAFSVRGGAPQVHGFVGRSVTPIRAAGYAAGRAVPRAGSSYFSTGPRMTSPGGPAFPTGRASGGSSREYVTPRSASPNAPSRRAVPRAQPGTVSPSTGRTYVPSGRAIERSAPSPGTVQPRPSAAPMYRGGGYESRPVPSSRTAPGRAIERSTPGGGTVVPRTNGSPVYRSVPGYGPGPATRTPPAASSPYGRWAPRSSYGQAAPRSVNPGGASPYGRYAPRAAAPGGGTPSMRAVPRPGGTAATGHPATAAPRGGNNGGGHGGANSGSAHGGGNHGGGHHRIG